MNKDFFVQKFQTYKSELKPGENFLIVSKTRSVDEIQAYYDLGHRDFGENRVQELSEKAEHFKDNCPDIRWHMIGNIQSNKINQLFEIPGLWAIHSVDDKDLLKKMVKAQGRLKHAVNIFLQYNTSKEDEKAGFEDYESLKQTASMIQNSSRLILKGLMTMGTLRTENREAEARRCFKELHSLTTKLGQDLGLKLETSMGMSGDYKVALEEDSKWIRLGTVMFP